MLSTISALLSKEPNPRLSSLSYTYISGSSRSESSLLACSSSASPSSSCVSASAGSCCQPVPYRLCIGCIPAVPGAVIRPTYFPALISPPAHCLSAPDWPAAEPAVPSAALPAPSPDLPRLLRCRCQSHLYHRTGPAAPARQAGPLSELWPLPPWARCEVREAF